MSYRHKELAAGQWGRMPFLEQMANIGSEIERALNWRAKNNAPYAERAFERALELFDLTLDGVSTPSQAKEVARAREAAADYFLGANQFRSTDESWRRYFSAFAYAARKNC